MANAMEEPAEQKVSCKKEKPTGSNRPVMVCRPVPGAVDRELTNRDMSILHRQSEALTTPPPSP